ncbi:MAG: MAPEG family protein, partial [Anderseniella sp.]|nr:MAPEG family protein [Anderseniella sp.]
KSQFELPVLFFAAIAIALATGITATSFTVLCWLFVAARVVHAVVHCGPNVLAPRFISFLVSVVAVSGLWLIITTRILMGL